MNVTNLKLTQFRNFSEKSLTFEHTVLVIGPNGSGKTNLIEAIRLLSLLKSFRARTDQEAIQFEKNFFRIEGEIHEQKTNRIAVYVSRDDTGKIEKSVKIDGSPNRLTEAVGFLKTVLFTAEEVNLVAAAPSKRRHFFDFLLSQLDRKYLFSLAQYKQTLKQRNEVLNWIKMNQASAADLEGWNEPLVEYGQYLQEKRTELAQFFNQILPEKLRFVTLSRALTRDSLTASLNKDIQLAATTVGPHRDDFELTLDDKSLMKYGSRGQWRRAAILLKVAEVEYIFHVSQNKPVLLADDLFSELDFDNRQLVEFRNVGQSIYTSPEIAVVPEPLKKQAQLIEL